MIKNLCLTLFATTLLCSCQLGLVNLPPVADSHQVIVPDPASLPNKRNDSCSALAMPEPIPKVVHIAIEPGAVKADAGGDQLLRNYAAVRKAIKACQK